MNVQQQIASLLAERAEIDVELEKLRQQAMQELEDAKAAVASLDSVLKPAPKAERPVSPVQPIDETDAGRGVREINENVSAASFTEELASLRERTQEKRRRLQ